MMPGYAMRLYELTPQDKETTLKLCDTFIDASTKEKATLPQMFYALQVLQDTLLEQNGVKNAAVHELSEPHAWLCKNDHGNSHHELNCMRCGEHR